MLIKYKTYHSISFEEFDYYEIENQVIKKMNQKYPTNNFTLESIELCGKEYYAENKGNLFTGKAFVVITQKVPYGQKPKGDWFEINYIG